MSISTPFIRRPVATSLLMAAFLLVGIAAYPFLPVAPLPRVDFPTIAVTGKFPGASPETMAATVAQPLEYQFAQIPGVSQMTSISAVGSTQITIQFDLDRNIDAAAGDIQAAINAAGGQLPKNLPGPPTYRKVNPADSPIMILSLSSDAMPMINVDDYADTILSQQISQIAGVSQVVIGGEQKRAVRVQVDPAKLANMGMTLGGRARHAGQRHGERAQGHHRQRPRARFAIYDNDQLTQGVRIRQRHPRLPQRRGGAGARRRRGRSTGRRTTSSRAGHNNRREHPPARVQAAGRERHRHRRAREGGPPPARGGNPAHRESGRGRRPDPDDPRVGGRRPVHADAVDRSRGHGDLPVPAQRLGDGDPEHHGAGGARVHLRRDVPARLQPRQSVADGAHDLGRLRRRRRHRHAGEYLPPCRAGHEADGGGAQGRGRDRLHDHLDQPFR